LRKKEGKAKSDHVQYSAVKDIDQVATVLEAMYQNMFVDEKESLWNRMVSILITSGSIKKTIKGMKPIDFYLQYVRAIRERIGNRIPIILIVDAISTFKSIIIRNIGSTDELSQSYTGEVLVNTLVFDIMAGTA